jgi:pimeloyl-ACP methyl ester carboxylesterase
LDRLDTAVTTLLIYVHGINRNGLAYFEYGEEAVRSARQKKQTLLIAPQYADKSDLEAYFLTNDFLYWKKAEWKDGHTSLNDHNTPMSSYEVMDSLLVYVLGSGRFPNIKRVVVAGHSAGGQFVQRYSAISPVPDLFTPLQFRFLVMDPSSYMYPDAKRPLTDKTFGIPDTAGCPDYNHYPKGLENLNPYARAAGADRIVNNMLHRAIFILLGAEDTRTDDPNLDISCAANLEGAFRLERGMNFFAYIRTFPGYEDKKNFLIVPDSGHSGEMMINSDEARRVIYGP